MKKIFMAASLVAGLTLITSCSVKLSENEKNSDYNNTIYRGRNTHNFNVINNKLDNFIVINNKLDKVINNKLDNFIVINNKLDKVIENQERIIEQNEEMLKMLNKQ